MIAEYMYVRANCVRLFERIFVAFLLSIMEVQKIFLGQLLGQALFLSVFLTVIGRFTLP